MTQEQKVLFAGLTAIKEVMESYQESEGDQKMDETPTRCDDIDDCCPTYDNDCDHLKPDEGDDNDILTLLELLITKQVDKHLEDGTFPSLKEAQAIAILDQVNNRYTDR